VLDVSDEGCRIEWSNEYAKQQDPHDYFLFGFHGLSDGFYSGDKYLVADYGTYSYTTVMGGKRVIKALRKLSDEEVADYYKLQKELKIQQNKEEQDRLATEAESRRMNKEIQDKQIRLKMVEYTKQCATNGLPSYQYDLGKMYMYGDRVEINQTLATYWLTKAASNGNTNASNLLNHIGK
jgi:TPR repeat protein